MFNISWLNLCSIKNCQCINIYWKGRWKFRYVIGLFWFYFLLSHVPISGSWLTQIKFGNSIFYDEALQLSSCFQIYHRTVTGNRVARLLTPFAHLHSLSLRGYERYFDIKMRRRVKYDALFIKFWDGNLIKMFTVNLVRYQFFNIICARVNSLALIFVDMKSVGTDRIYT